MKTIQLNLRVKETVAEEFKEFCKSQQLTQSDGMQALLDLRDGVPEPTVPDPMQTELLRQERDAVSVLRHTLAYILRGEMPPEPEDAGGMYQYPASSSCGLVSLEDLVRDGTALHVYCVRQDNAARIKLTAPDHSMITQHERHATRGAMWFIGYVHRPDDTAEIVAAVPSEALKPMSALWKTSGEKTDGQTRGLDDLILGAASRHVYSKPSKIG